MQKFAQTKNIWKIFFLPLYAIFHQIYFYVVLAILFLPQLSFSFSCLKYHIIISLSFIYSFCHFKSIVFLAFFHVTTVHNTHRHQILLRSWSSEIRNNPVCFCISCASMTWVKYCVWQESLYWLSFDHYTHESKAILFVFAFFAFWWLDSISINDQCYFLDLTFSCFLITCHIIFLSQVWLLKCHSCCFSYHFQSNWFLCCPCDFIFA